MGSLGYSNAAKKFSQGGVHYAPAPLIKREELLPFSMGAISHSGTATAVSESELVEKVTFSSVDETAILEDGKEVETSKVVDDEKVVALKRSKKLRVTVKVKNPAARKLLGLR